MSALSDPRIEALQDQAGASGVLNLPSGEGCFRNTLRDENIELWRETLEQQHPTHSTQLLLACEESSGEIKNTRLTWVVGSAIRRASAESPTAVALLLQELGVPELVTQAAVDRCPGLGEDLVWAFYLERHGWLIATPVAAIQP